MAALMQAGALAPALWSREQAPKPSQGARFDGACVDIRLRDVAAEEAEVWIGAIVNLQGAAGDSGELGSR